MDGSGTNSPRVTSQAQPTGTARRSLHVHNFSSFSYLQQGDVSIRRSRPRKGINAGFSYSPEPVLPPLTFSPGTEEFAFTFS